MTTLDQRSAHGAAGGLGILDAIDAVDLGRVARQVYAACEVADRLATHPRTAGGGADPPALGRAGAGEVGAPLVARALLTRADTVLEDAAQGERLAEIAIELLAPWMLAAGGRHLKPMLRAFWHLVRCRLRLARLAPAGAAYRAALALGAAAPGGADEERAALFAARAQLAWRQAQIEDAASFFEQGAQIFADSGERQSAAACRIQAGFVQLALGRPEAAAGQLQPGHLLIDPDLAPALAARTALALSWSNLAIGRRQQARERLRAARGLYGAAHAAGGAGEECVHLWWEARIADADAQPVAAQDRLDAVRQTLLRTGSPAEAATAARELWARRVLAGGAGHGQQLAADLTAAFPVCPRAAHAARQIAATDDASRSAGSTARAAAIATAHRWCAVPPGMLPPVVAPLAGGGEHASARAGRDRDAASDAHPADGVLGDGDRTPRITDLSLLADRLLVAERQGFATLA